nr:transmembrane 4 L6 family member 19 isoform X3 [Chlorocebus sabaeus]
MEMSRGWVIRTGLSEERKRLQCRLWAGAWARTHAWVTSAYIESLPGPPGQSPGKTTFRSSPGAAGAEPPLKRQPCSRFFLSQSESGQQMQVLTAAILISLMGWRYGCFSKSGLCRSVLTALLSSGLALLGALICFVTSGAALKDGPFCMFDTSSFNQTQAWKYGYPFKDLHRIICMTVCSGTPSAWSPLQLLSGMCPSSPPFCASACSSFSWWSLTSSTASWAFSAASVRSDRQNLRVQAVVFSSLVA